MPDIDFAFLADAAQARPGEKFHVLGGGVSRLAARVFPFRHPHLALVIGLSVTAPESAGGSYSLLSQGLSLRGKR